MHIRKRNGSLVEFDKDKVISALSKAFMETEDGLDEDLICEIADCIEEDINETVGVIPTVESIQDMCEDYLMDSNRKDVARRYILYRAERAKLREQGWEMTDLQKDIYEKKYRLDNETFEQFLSRVGGGNKAIEKAIKNKAFLPAGRILAGRGLAEHGRKVTLSNCYVMPKVEDNLESIFDTAKWLARTYSYGGGCGVNLSNLRPTGSRVQNSAHTTTGSTSFMDLYSLVTGLIGQKGRRGALMLNMDVDHPDIEEFIDIKSSDSDRVRFANISVNMTDEFMEAVEKGEEFECSFNVEATGEKITRKVNARKVFEKLAFNNWNSAEPGILFKDNIDNWHLMSADPNFEFAGVNPCAEEPLPAFGSCNLSSINLAEYVQNPFTENAYFDFDAFKVAVGDGVVYLNEILDENMNLHPLKQQTETSRDLRQIGLGIMGLADMLIKMGIKYGDSESLDIIDSIGSVMINSALQKSALLAKEHGTFPLYDKEKIFKSEFLLENATDETLKLIDMYGLRNSQVLTIAPTGSISTMIGVSGGVEPIFQLSYTRKSETLHNEDTYYKVFTPIVKEYMEMHGIENEKDLPNYFVTTSDLSYKDRIDVQAVWQKYIDASISSTVNLPEETTVEEVAELYMYAWSKGLKGITIYRDGCARGGILITDKPKKSEDRLDKIDELKAQIDELVLESLSENPDVCPMCGGHMNHSGGCEECQDCGYSPCSI